MKIEFEEITYYEWECPECGELNQNEVDPELESELSCDECGEVFVQDVINPGNWTIEKEE